MNVTGSYFHDPSPWVRR